MTMLYVSPIGLLWAAWYLYWGISAFGAKQTRRREPILSRVSNVAPLLLAAWLLAVPRLWRGWLCGQFLPRSPETYWLGVGLLVIGLGFSIWARRYLGRNWSGTVTVKQDHELIRTGPYRFVRHPIYTGILLGFLGTAVALGQWRGLLAVALATFAFLLKIRLEEKWMTETFGDAYRRYRAEVKALIPFVL